MASTFQKHALGSNSSGYKVNDWLKQVKCRQSTLILPFDAKVARGISEEMVAAQQWALKYFLVHTCLRKSISISKWTCVLLSSSWYSCNSLVLPHSFFTSRMLRWHQFAILTAISSTALTYIHTCMYGYVYISHHSCVCVCFVVSVALLQHSPSIISNIYFNVVHLLTQRACLYVLV